MVRRMGLNIFKAPTSNDGLVCRVPSIRFALMKRLPLSPLAVASVVLFAFGCGEKKPVVTHEAPSPVRLKPKPKVYQGEDLKAGEAARDAAMAKEIAELEAESKKLRQEIAREQLVMDREALEEEQRRLEVERAAWLSEQVAAAARTQPVTPVSQPVILPPARDYSLFYTGLAAQGSWFQSVDYGYVWQPTVARQTSWRPYTVGRWAASDRGWTWLSDEAFGWATYHYGRWAKLKECGWIWVPGEVWAPAWVAWRRSNTHVGWCPLPPETLYRDEVTYDSSIDKLCGIHPSSYIFIAVKQFCLPVHRHCEPPDRSKVVCRDTTNITRLCVTRHRVDGSGPKYEWIKARQPRPPEQYILTNDPLTQADRKFRIAGDKLCVFSPVMRAPWNHALRPRDLAGPLPEGSAVPQETVLPDKTQRRFREDKKQWMAAAGKALQAESARRLTERQNKVEALTAAVQNPVSPRQPARLPGLPADVNLTLPQPGTNPDVAPTAPSLAERRTRREHVRKEVLARQADLAQMRGLPLAKDSAPPRSSAVTREPMEVETAAASLAAQEATVRESTAPSAEVPTVRPDVTAPESLARRAARADLEARRAEVARLRETQALRQRQPMLPQPQIPPSPEVPEPAEPTRPVPTAGPQPPVGVAGGLPEKSPPGRDDPAALAERREKAARINVELAARLQAQEQQRQARVQAQTERDLALAQSAAAAAQHREAVQVEASRELQQKEIEANRQRVAAEDARRAEQDVREEAQRQAEERSRQQESARQHRDVAERAQREQAAHEQAQRQVEERARQEEMARQQREAAERAQQEQAAREQAQRQAQREAEERARQEEMARQQREAAERAQQEQAAREQAQRQAEERARQEEMARQQREAAERAQQEQAAREQAQRQAEERAQQEQAAREQAAREQAQRQADEAAKNGNK